MSDAPAPKRGRGRPRREGAGDEILAVTLALLREGGYQSVTIDAVAVRAGVAKTTLYRRWPSKSALIAAAIAPAAALDATDAEEILRGTADLLRAFTNADAEAIEVVAALLRPRHERLRALVGEQEADRLIGALLTRLFVTHAPIPGTP